MWGTFFYPQLVFYLPNIPYLCCLMIKIPVDTTNNPEINVWITSDTHYSHKNICRGVTAWRTKEGEIPVSQTRDFATIEKMNSSIVNNINEVVGQDDMLIHLGDWSFGGFEQIREFWDRIICKNVHLVLGNHDHHIENNRDGSQGLFKSVSHYNTLEIGQFKFRLMHYPISSWDGLGKGVMHLHGHCHLPNNLKLSKGQRMDVGMDGHTEFRPYNVYREVVPLLRNRPKVSEIGEYDHHLDELQNKDKG
jgi:calcineurin-like phosphoesterase family protein